MDDSEASPLSAAWDQPRVGKRFPVKPLLRLTAGNTSEIPTDIAVGKRS